MTTLTWLKESKNEFLGFNLVIGDKDNLIHYSNANRKTSIIDDGIHIMTNTTFNNNWLKGDTLRRE